MVRVEPMNNCRAGIDTNQSTMFTLLLELNVICEYRWIGCSSNCKLVPVEFDGKEYTVICIWWQRIHCHLGNLWNRITTKIFDIFRIITLKQKKTFSVRSSPDPPIFKKLQSDPVLIRQKLASVLIQSDPILIRAHLCEQAIVQIFTYFETYQADLTYIQVELKF